MPFVSELPPPFAPAKSLAETGLSYALISDLIVKAVYNAGSITAAELAARLHLRFAMILPMVREYTERGLFIVRSVNIEGRSESEYSITQLGQDQARYAFERGEYDGPAPVPLQAYIDGVHAQTARYGVITQEQIRKVYQDMVLPDSLLSRLGPAINSRRSLFLYGPPGNGKTTIAQRFAKLLGDDIFVPFAIAVDTYIIRFFDPIYHQAVMDDSVGAPLDERWIRIKRPVVIVGGEMTLEALNLVYEPALKYYEAPPQMKANNGIFMIDDFGRQLTSPAELLNRWIVPLAEGVDYLTLHTGKRLQVPFDEMIVFSTNLEPRDLVDEAFLRRIRYKLEVGNPDEAAYRTIFHRVCDHSQVPYVDSAVTYLLKQRYPKSGQPLRACHPSDLLAQIVDIARVRGVAPQLTPELINEAWDTYFAQIVLGPRVIANGH